jgi:lipoic acid synthetase
MIGEMMLEKPLWLRKKMPIGQKVNSVIKDMDEKQLYTICQEACCPNQGECFSSGVATFLIMGNICTRNCAFCAVSHGKPEQIDSNEPQRLVQEIQKLNLKFVVITSVTRDDLPDGGSTYFSRLIQLIRKNCKGVGIEVLIPDFKGIESSLQNVVNATPEVLNHNVETVPRLYSDVRPQAVYKRSLELLKRAKEGNRSIITKTGLMVGLGETKDEIEQVFHDLRVVQCDTLTIGQYLCPSKEHFPVAEYVRPEVFEEYKTLGIDMGFKSVVSSPFARSSFMAETSYKMAKKLNST